MDLVLLRGVEAHEGICPLGAGSLEGLLELNLRQSLRVVQRHCENVTHALFQELDAFVLASGLVRLMPGGTGDARNVEGFPLKLRKVGSDPPLGFGVGDGAAPESVRISNACR